MPDPMMIASTEFQNRAGLYLEKAAKEPVFITRHKRPVRVLLDIEEYERLKVNDRRHAYYIEELPDDLVTALQNVGLDHIDPALDRLLDEPDDKAGA
jgi:prevent-host-death family protein